MEKKKCVPIHLIDDEKNGFTPLQDIGTIQRDMETNPAPKSTPICRMALKAIAGNTDLFKRARDLGIAGGEKSYSGLIRHCLSQAIRLETFAQKKKNESQAAA